MAKTKKKAKKDDDSVEADVKKKAKKDDEAVAERVAEELGSEVGEAPRLVDVDDDRHDLGRDGLAERDRCVPS